MSQRADEQTRRNAMGRTSAEERGTGRTSTGSSEPSAARQAGISLLKKAGALFFGVGLNRRHPERERARRRAYRQRAEEEGYATPVATHMFSGRSFLMAVMVGVIALGTTYPVLTYMDQDREMNRIHTHISQLQQENAQLKAEQTWWNDENYVRQQARSRLYYVNPGDTPYVVTGITDDSSKADKTSANAKNAPEDAWTTKVWDSLEKN